MLAKTKNISDRKIPFNRSLTKAVVLISVAFLTALPVQAAPEGGIAWKEGQILVQPRAGLPDTRLQEILNQRGGKSLGLLRQLDVHVVKVPANAEGAVAKALSQNPNIIFAEKDFLVETTETIPDDPEFSNAWHLAKMEAPLAWDMARANGVTVAILDSGVNGNHPDLNTQMLPGWNSVSNDSNTGDINGHGTKVAGTAAAAVNNATGAAGLAWNANILPVRVSNHQSGAAYASDIANGLTWAADNGANVANISYHISTSSAVISAARYMRNQGGLVVVAAGNSGNDTGLADNPDLIAVAATTPNDDKASFSNYGNYIDVAAPGVNILTTTKYNDYDTANGTSFASPATAGVVALIMGANPSLTPDEVENILEQSADDLIDGTDWHAYYGHGRVNAARAVQMAVDSGGVPADFESPYVTLFSPADYSSVSDIVAIEVNATDNMGVSEVALYVDDQLLGVDDSSPYQFSWDSTLSFDGEATLTARAHDAAGNESSSNPVVVNVENVPGPDPDVEPPTVNILNPHEGTNVGRTVSIEVNAFDETELAQVELFIDGILVATAVDGALAYDWNTKRVADGSHTIEATAIDASGNSSFSQVHVTKSKGTTGGTSSGSKGKGKNK